MLENATLDDKYTRTTGRVYLTGVQALVRLPLEQQRLDERNGLKTAGFISGYRGSPLGTYDAELGKAQAHLERAGIRFMPGVNEDLAATAVWGTQQAEVGGEGRYDGVFAIWYGKGPGVDRTGDAFRHANLAGSSARGGVLVLTGDDHTCESSTTCHQSEFALIDAAIPVLSPAGVQELLDFGMAGWAMSRFSGCWVGMKCVKDTADASLSVDLDPTRFQFQTPVMADLPPDGLNLRQPDTPQAQEVRLHHYKLDAVRAFVRANRLDRVTHDAPDARLGIITHGKSYLDLCAAFDELGLDEAALARAGVRVYKVACTWPLEPEGLRAFAQGLTRIVVIEEKRSLLEAQLKDILYGIANAPSVVGKKDEAGRRLFQEEMALDPVQIAIALAERLPASPELAARAATLSALRAVVHPPEAMVRSFYFCSGCPHNRSTVLPEGSKGYAGIGCSWMAQTMDRNTLGYTHMGGEGMTWVGEAPFSKRRHMFQNLGDGTYFHSGLLAIRAAAAAGTNITYKILFNDAVAMTGGQRHDGPLTPPLIAAQVHAEGARAIAVVCADPERYRDTAWPAGTTVHHRDDLQAVQERLRDVEGLSVLIYDQMCAAERRRRRKRKLYPDPPKRLVINENVCEGCGDCGVKSNCVAVVPLETAFGRKRAIDQSACNKDYSCNDGFCPSFVTVQGGTLRRPRGVDAGGPSHDLPEPVLPSLDDRSYAMVVTGVGGTGVVTIGALLGMAAHLDGLGVGVLDMAGLAQKGGSVWSHLRFGKTPADITSIRVATGCADVILGGDLVVSASNKTLGMAQAGRTRMIVNTAEVMTGDFTRKPDLPFPALRLRRAIETATGEASCDFVEATRLATALMGDAVAANMLLLGFAFQRGAIPVSSTAILRAIELNGTAVLANQQAFAWGRRLALDPAAVLAQAADRVPAQAVPETLDEILAHRKAFLTAYQNATYADRYAGRVAQVRAWEQQKFGDDEITRTVARGYAKLLAYKDEYEVARLHADPAFVASLRARFEGDIRLRFNLAPPLLSRIDPRTGVPRKREFGAWMLPVFRGMARLRGLRGTPFDPFGHTAERRMERSLIARYETTLDQLMTHGRADNRELVLALAALPERVRGYGHVKQRHVDEVLPQWTRWLDDLAHAPVVKILKRA
jgi:indolepyruvate ferredoxin oxidoreductase